MAVAQIEIEMAGRCEHEWLVDSTMGGARLGLPAV